MKRLFFALWPDRKIREECSKLTTKLKSPGTRPVKPENLHVTLAFLGSVTEEKEQSLRKLAANTACPEVSLSFDRVEFWRRPQVLCLSATEENTHLSKLANELSELAKSVNITMEERPYVPHVTLLRKVKSAPEEINFEPVRWTANTFCLVESCSTHSGVSYQVVELWS